MSSIDTVKARCQSQIDLNEVQIQEMEMEIQEGKEQLSALKSKLYSKFGDAIRLDYDWTEHVQWFKKVYSK